MVGYPGRVRSGPKPERGGGDPLGQIEYRLARERVVRDFHKGRVSRLEVCDAQSELLRVARNLGQTTPTDCPICEDSKLVHVSFAFGPRLPASGRAVASRAELAALARSGNGVTCYVVEVCTACSWNHLVRMLSPGGRAERAV